MTSNDDTETCEYVAYRDRPETWHGEDPEDWYPGDVPDWYWIEGDSWSCPHDALEGGDENYCVFHTEPEDVLRDVDEGELLVSAIEEAIEAEDGSEARRKAEFVGATFGELTLDELPSGGEGLSLLFDHTVFRGAVTGSTPVHQPISFFDTKCEFGTVFKDVTFEKYVEFRGVTFKRLAGFSGATFKRDVRFSGTTFEGNARFSGAIFKENVWFEEATFKGPAGFSGARFKGDVWFDEATFEEYAGFDEATFKEYAGFDEATFREFGWFRGTTFEGDVGFSNARFKGTAEFRRIPESHRTMFKGAVWFNEATFEGAVWFDESMFMGSAGFSGTTFEKNARFTGTTLEGDVEFADSSFVGGDLSGPSEWPSPTSFEKANFTDADLTNVSLAGTDLTGARFSRATLYGTDFSNAKLDGTIFGEAQINERTNFGQFAPDTDGPSEDRALDATDENDDDTADGSNEDALEGDEESPVERTDDRVTERPLRVVYDPFGGPEDTASETEDGLAHRFKRIVNRYRYWHMAAWLNGSDDHSAEDETPESESELAATDGGSTRGGPHPDTHLRKAATTYHVIENLARHNSLPSLQSQAFVRRQEMHRLKYAKNREFGKWLRASAARATLLYGESPWRVIGASLFVILLFGMLYPLGGFRDPDSGEVVEAGSVGEWVATLPDGIYFSTLTFTTLGFGDFQPVSWGKVLATMETALGATLIALLVFVLGRRAAR